MTWDGRPASEPELGRRERLEDRVFCSLMEEKLRELVSPRLVPVGTFKVRDGAIVGGRQFGNLATEAFRLATEEKYGVPIHPQGCESDGEVSVPWWPEEDPESMDMDDFRIAKWRYYGTLCPRCEQAPIRRETRKGRGRRRGRLCSACEGVVKRGTWEHGSRLRYWSGCRCDECRVEQAHREQKGGR